jgi:[citrate (pro-3S)-lyase] ligase
MRTMKRAIGLYRIVRRECKYIVKAYRYLHARKVRLVYFELPVFDKIRNLSSFEVGRIENWKFDFDTIKKELPWFRKIYGNEITVDYITALFEGGIVVNDGNRRRVLDFCNAYVHIINGIRLTIGQPKSYNNIIYTHGACTIRGTGVEDSQTIASFIQENCNLRFPHNAYCVVNMGIGRGSTVYDDYKRMKENIYHAGDIVVWCPFNHVAIPGPPRKLAEKLDFHYHETSHLFNRPHEYGEWFIDDVLHTNKIGNKVLADFIFNKLLEHKIIDDETANIQLPGELAKTDRINSGPEIKIYANNSEFRGYLRKLKKLKKENKKSLIGCIVMNCNPFTNGHKYLIEYASACVDFLYIFVVEENKSYFSFEDRYNLIRLGTSCLQNVILLPSGKFIISALTFPGYFYKDNLKDATIDCSTDVTLFAQYIAPILNIKIRFAGEEPLDPVTNQYNQAMAELLPCYSIEFRVIPRKESGGQVISASRVREYYENGNLEKIRELVPQTTYEYLTARNYHKDAH